jgi:glycosyltransferase involved in cell wall biosynthesis
MVDTHSFLHGKAVEMMKKELISVVIPAFNAKDFIECAIKSCFKQTYRPIEIVVVNDGSTDSTVEVVYGLSNSELRKGAELSVVDLGQNRGVANALNVGFSSARGAYICWLSADDAFIDNEKLDRQAVYMKRTGALWSYCKYVYRGADFSSANLVRGSYLPRLGFLNPLFTHNSDLRVMALLFRNPINGSSIMIRRDCIESFGQFDPVTRNERVTRNIDPDGDLWMRYSLLKLKLATMKGAPVFYREHATQTSKKKHAMLYGSELTRMRILSVLKKKGVLAQFIRKFTPYFPVVLGAQQHFGRPFVSEFLYNYCLDHKKEFDRIFLKYISRALVAVRKHPNYLSLDKRRFSEDLGVFMESQMFKKFEEIFFRR